MRVVFLDIDGVLQHERDEERHNHDLDQLQSHLAETYNDPRFLECNKYDLGAAYYDWDKDSVQRLRVLLRETSAVIVVSSAWRKQIDALQRLRTYFRVHGLEKYVVGVTPDLDDRAEEIREYIARHADIDGYVVIDDAHQDVLRESFPANFVHCTSGVFDDSDLAEALRIMSLV